MDTSDNDPHRHPRNAKDAPTPAKAGSSGRGGLTALPIVVVLLGGLVAYSSLGPPPAETPAPATEPATPESITDSPASPAE